MKKCRRLWILALSTLFVLSSRTAFGDDCHALFQIVVGGENFEVTLTSMNKNGVASYAEFHLVPQAGGKKHSKAQKTYTRLVGRGSQVFNDRALNVAGAIQHFNSAKADTLSLEITDGQSVTARLVLESWGNGTMDFTPTCEDGFMHGNASGTYVLLHFGRVRQQPTIEGGVAPATATLVPPAKGQILPDGSIQVNGKRMPGVGARGARGPGDPKADSAQGADFPPIPPPANTESWLSGEGERLLNVMRTYVRDEDSIQNYLRSSEAQDTDMRSKITRRTDTILRLAQLSVSQP